MKKKYIIAIGVFIVVILGSLLLNERFFNTEKEITQNAALRETPHINISPDEISLMNKLRDDSDIQQAMLNAENDKENIINFSADKLSHMDEKLFPENSVITVNSGLVFVAYRLDGYTITLRIDPDGDIHKTVLLLRANNSVKVSWENHNNEIYLKYQFGLF